MVELWRGATRPSAGALAGTLAVAAGLLAGGACVFDERFVARHGDGALLLSEDDDAAWISARGLRGWRAIQAESLTVLLGASDLREATVGDAEMTGLLDAAGERASRAVTLCADQLGLLDRIGVLERFGFDFPGTLVVGVNLAQLNKGLDSWQRTASSHHLGFRSALVAAECRGLGLRPPPITGVDFWDNASFFLRRTRLLWPTVRGARVQHRRQRFYRTAGAAASAAPAPAGPLDRDAAAANLRALEILVAKCRSAGRCRVVLVEVPTLEEAPGASLSPERLKIVERSRLLLDEFARRHEVPLLRPAVAAGLRSEDYCDPRHIGSDAARARFSLALVRALTERRPRGSS